jgi:hypothetical protein
MLAAVTSAGCGGSAPRREAPTTVTAPATASPGCGYQAELIVDAGEQILLHYGSQSAYPADVGYFTFKGALAEFERRGCDRRVLGRSLVHRLSPAKRAALLSHLPAAMARHLRGALEAAGAPG